MLRNFNRENHKRVRIPWYPFSGGGTTNVTGLTVNNNRVSTTLLVGASETFNALPRDISLNPIPSQSITWASANTAIATVNNGTIVGVASGSTVITATNNGYTRRILATVLPSPTLLGSDGFTRADNATSIGKLDTGQTWLSSSAAIGGIKANRAYFPAASTDNLVYFDGGNANVVQKARVPVPSSNPGFYVRYSDANNWVRFRYDSQMYLEWNLAGAKTFDYTATTVEPNDLITVRASGSTVQVQINNNIVFHQTITTNQSASNCGFGMGSNAQASGSARYTSYSLYLADHTPTKTVASIFWDVGNASVPLDGILNTNAWPMNAYGEEIGAHLQAVTYTSQNTGIATIASNGVITPVAQGTAILSASAAGFLATMSLTVTANAGFINSLYWDNAPSTASGMNWGYAGEHDMSVLPANVSANLVLSTDPAIGAIKSPNTVITGSYVPQTVGVGFSYDPGFWTAASGTFSAGYYCWWQKYSTNFEGHYDGVNKEVEFLRDSTIGSGLIGSIGSGSNSPLYVQCNINGGTDPRESLYLTPKINPDAQTIRGQWKKFEVVVVNNTTASNGDVNCDGQFHSWVNGRKCEETTGLIFQRTGVPGWVECKPAFVWGGQQGVITKNNSVYVDHEHVRSGSAGGAAGYDGSWVFVPPSPTPTSSLRSLLLPHARFRVIQRWPTGNAGDDAFAAAHFSDIDGGTLASHPNAITVQGYSLLNKIEIDTGAVYTSSIHLWTTASVDLGDAYATAQGDNVEDYWCHASASSQNYKMTINSISNTGAIVLRDLGHGGSLSFPYVTGSSAQIKLITGLTSSFTISSIQSNGVTVSGWGGSTFTNLSGTSLSGSVCILGDGTKTRANRQTIFFWSEWRNVPNFANASARAWNVSKAVSFIGTTRNTILYDEMDSSNIDACKVWTTLEYPSAPSIFGTPGPGQVLFVNDMCTTIQQMMSASGGPSYLRNNTSGFKFSSDIQIARTGRGIHDESELNIWSVYAGQSNLNYVIDRVAEGIDIEYSNGDTYTIVNGTASMAGIPSTVTPGNYPNTSSRAQMSYYSLYLLAVDPSYTASDGSIRKHCILDMTNGWAVNQTPISAMWPPAFDVNIGQPLGRPQSQSRTDPAGFGQVCCQRAFSIDGATTSSYVVCNLQGSGHNNWGENSLLTTTLPTPPVGKTWFMLRPDGTFSGSYTSVNTRVSEGVIFMAR